MTLMQELEERTGERQQKLAEVHTSVESALSKLADVVRFGDRVMQNGNATEILLMKRAIMNQIRFLINSLPPNNKYSCLLLSLFFLFSYSLICLMILPHKSLDSALDLNIRFVNDERRFEKSLVDTFGRFYTHKEIKQNYWNSLTSMNNAAAANSSVPNSNGGGSGDGIMDNSPLLQHSQQQPSSSNAMIRQQQLMQYQQLQQLQHALNSSNLLF